MTAKLHTAFALGVRAAEHVHGVDRKRNQAATDAIFRILDKVASGELTLIDTPEETIGNLPEPPPNLAAKASGQIKKLQDQLATGMPEAIRQAMHNDREVAAELLKTMQ
jgi:hypothetical protein